MTQERRCAVVTGAGSGIGAATVAALAREGWRVACLDRDGAGAARTAESAGDDHVAVQVDVTEEAGVAAAFERCAALLGRVDGLATCAGIVDATPFLELDAATFRRVYDVNVVGTFLCIREASKRMTPGGRICTVASVAGWRGGGVVGTAAYAASKGAVMALTKTAARALADRGICVNSVAPGPTLTPMLQPHYDDARDRLESSILLKRVGRPEEIADAIAWLLSPRASYVDGSTMLVDGGMVMI